MAIDILTPEQIIFLKALGSTPRLANQFYLSGGTPLAAFYLQHRYSEDLDFFSKEEIDAGEIRAFLETLKQPLGILRIAIKQSFNRNLFFVELPTGTLKTEFTYFPFDRIDRRVERKYGIEIDSPIDIATNKLFAIYERTKARDYIDLYLLCKQYAFTIDVLMKRVREKFDLYLEPIQLGTQFLKAGEAEDYPRMLIDLAQETWQTFFRKEAEVLRTQILDQNDQSE